MPSVPFQRKTKGALSTSSKKVLGSRIRRKPQDDHYEPLIAACKRSTIENLPRGRTHTPWATASEQDMLIVAAAAVKRSLTSQQIRCELNLSASTKTVPRRVRDVRLRNCVPALTSKLSEANKLARLLFAEDHATWMVEDWSCVNFTGGSTFSSRWDQRQRIWMAMKTRYE
ncbi:hypothetical protein HPB48_009421 [Haemaphysalis longicornis]|uniref:Transposase Tc1-like domain-containing protein n=1 Tax=Haemaphysalis longicornis TaxID=44386 RepID=A0A9J6GZU2_HAELO|nr:hypothetical protein HPB48_009421 [Haemaphysalis longicornis]